MRALAAVTLAIAVAVVRPARAIDPVLGPAELQRGLTMANQSDADRARFHRPYVIDLGDATATQLEVVSEVRRVVLLGEDRIRHGDHLFSARQANEELRPWRGKVTLILRLRFHPQNVLARVPEYTVAITAPPLAALELRRTPLYALGSTPKSGTAAPLTGGLVEADFDAIAIARTTREIVITLDKEPLARTTIDFSKLE